MIPKTINYCWFGEKEKPKSVKVCIESWKKFCPQYEIKEWNEDNFDLQCCDYVKEAAKEKKWAFVSDYARFWILYNYGGIYFDTDVEVIKSLDTIIKSGSFMACETQKTVNPGLGMATFPKSELYKRIIEFYSKQHFILNDGSENLETVVTKVTSILRKLGFKGTGEIEKVSGIVIYPVEYFCPLNYTTGKLNITNETVAIHHFDESWHSNLEKLIVQIERGENSFSRKLLVLPLKLVNKINKKGIKGTIKFIKSKYF
ncbi:glycosyltransferase family 32 protein [Limosilactobacillus vaginalis]|uniref:glycosyltransferase family 32 protein n=1 Tax=Limosilactobacillus vaginalis TaxID=1633 RepID=UPI0022E66B47|nr:glycosyltransferase [Limosilactobacillus vaginalis]